MNLSHPNAHLTPETICTVLGVAANAFHRCRMEPEQVDYCGCDSFLLGELGTNRFLVYVRITREDEQEDGCGPVPGVLIHAALELKAEPHLIRVHTHRVGKGIGFEYFGYHEFIDHVLLHCQTEIAEALLAPRTFSDCVRMLKGKVSNLQLNLYQNEWDPDQPHAIQMNRVIDGRPNWSNIDFVDLLRSARDSYVYEISTCPCGCAGCAGYWVGTTVVHCGELTLWIDNDAPEHNIFLFERSQYNREIFDRYHQLMELLNFGDCYYVASRTCNRVSLAKAYYEATRDGPEPAGIPLPSPAVRWARVDEE